MSGTRWLVAFLFFVLLPCAGNAEAFVPERDDEVLEILPASSHGEERELRRLRVRMAGKPDDLSLALRMAWRYVELGRRSGDPRYQGWAAGVMRRWLELPEPPAEALLLRATLRQNRHDFDAALGDLARLLEGNPRESRAWFARATILQVQGELVAARRSCLPLLRLAEPLLGVSCLSRVGAASGRAARAFDLLRQTLEIQSKAGPELRRFALTSLAEIAAQLGRYEEASRYFQSALSLGDPSVYLIAAYADFLLDSDRAEEALDLVEGREAADGLLLRRVLAESQLGYAAAGLHAMELEARYAAARRRGDPLHLGDEARFWLAMRNDPDASLRLALENFETQREPRDLRVLLEAALAADKPGAAIPALELLRELGLEDPNLERLARRIGAV